MPVADPLALLSGRRVLVWGLGAEGRSTLAFLERLRIPVAKLGVMDRNVGILEAGSFPQAQCHGEDSIPAVFAKYDCIIKSPGIPTARLELDATDRAKITCQTDLFLRCYPGAVVGVTGSKGKSTTSKLIALLLAAQDPSVRLAGNIGVPVLDLIEAPAASAPPVVCELSSYQLEYTRTSPPVAVLLNLYQDHLDFHGGFTPYIEAKWHIARFQAPGGKLVLPDHVPFPPEALPPGISIERFTPSGPFKAYGARFKDSMLLLDSPGGTLACSLVPALQTRHAREHLGAALTVAALFGVSPSAIQATLPSFAPLPHRLQALGAHGGIAFYDDSIATIPEAAIAAIESLPAFHTLITGGKDRGIDYAPFARYLADSPVRDLVLMPDTGVVIGRLLQPLPHPRLRIHQAETLENAVDLAFRVTPPGRSCLLSPAASSYNTHRNYEEKSRDFLQCILARAGQAA